MKNFLMCHFVSELPSESTGSMDAHSTQQPNLNEGWFCKLVLVVSALRKRRLAFFGGKGQKAPFGF